MKVQTLFAWAVAIAIGQATIALGDVEDVFQKPSPQSPAKGEPAPFPAPAAPSTTPPVAAEALPKLPASIEASSKPVTLTIAPAPIQAQAIQLQVAATQPQPVAQPITLTVAAAPVPVVTQTVAASIQPSVIQPMRAGPISKTLGALGSIAEKMSHQITTLGWDRVPPAQPQALTVAPTLSPVFNAPLCSRPAAAELASPQSPRKSIFGR